MNHFASMGTHIPAKSVPWLVKFFASDMSKEKKNQMLDKTIFLITMGEYS